VSPRGLRGWALALALAVAGTVAAPRSGRAVGDDPAAEVTEALRSLGAPGMVWGRLATEEESPVGGWTPIGGVDVKLYPATPSLVSELDRIRQSARTSGAQYESAVSRVQLALTAHQGRIDRQTAPPPGAESLVAEPPLIAAPRPPKPSPAPTTADARPRPGPEKPGGPAKAATPPDDPAHPWHQKTDPAGLFAFDAVPAGDWLVVLVRIAPYAAEKLRAEPKARQTSRTRNFLPRAAGPAKEAEVWLSRIRVVAGERVGLELSDRGRWLVGPIR
jgi:hypothetical protein